MEEAQKAVPSEERPAAPQEPAKDSRNTLMAAVAYILFFVPLLTDAKDDPYVKYHVKQGLVLFLTWFVVTLVGWVPPILFVSWLLHIAMLALMVIGILHALNGKQEPLPVIGQLADKVTF